MSDTPVKTKEDEQVERIRRLWRWLDEQEALIDKLERELVELEQKRREDVRKCDGICKVVAAGTLSADAIRAAFPEVFK